MKAPLPIGWQTPAAFLFAFLLGSRTDAASLPGLPPPPTLPVIEPATLSDTQKVARLAKQLERKFPTSSRPEAVKMLLSVLRGTWPSTTDSWFGPAESRFHWKWLADQHQLKLAKATITKEEFRGSAALWSALDRDGNGRITADDLNWSETNSYVIQANLATRFFRRMNPRGDGQLTKDDMSGFFDRAAQGKDHLTPEGLRTALLASGAGGFLPGDAPTTEMLVRGLYAGELGSIHEGPRLGARAPDFELKTLDGQKTVTLSKLIGPKPVVLVFGNFTCGPFRSLTPDVEAVYQRHQDRAIFLLVYVREAHPTDGWVMASNTKLGVEVRQPTTYDERVRACGLFTAKLKPSLPMLVDEMDDRVGHGYSAMPARLYVIDRRGNIAYKSGRGPFGFLVGEMEQALAMTLLEAELAK